MPQLDYLIFEAEITRARKRFSYNVSYYARKYNSFCCFYEFLPFTSKSFYLLCSNNKHYF